MHNKQQRKPECWDNIKKSNLHVKFNFQMRGENGHKKY